MAPACLCPRLYCTQLGDVYDERADVYSFGVLLAELVREAQRLLHHGQLDLPASPRFEVLVCLYKRLLRSFANWHKKKGLAARQETAAPLLPLRWLDTRTGVLAPAAHAQHCRREHCRQGSCALAGKADDSGFMKMECLASMRLYGPRAAHIACPIHAIHW